MSVTQMRGVTPLKYFQKLKEGSTGASCVFMWDEFITQRQLDGLIKTCKDAEAAKAVPENGGKA